MTIIYSRALEGMAASLDNIDNDVKDVIKSIERIQKQLRDTYWQMDLDDLTYYQCEIAMKALRKLRSRKRELVTVINDYGLRPHCL